MLMAMNSTRTNKPTTAPARQEQARKAAAWAGYQRPKPPQRSPDVVCCSFWIDRAVAARMDRAMKKLGMTHRGARTDYIIAALLEKMEADSE